MIAFKQTKKLEHKLSKEDQLYLTILQKRCGLPKDRTVSITKRFKNGLYAISRLSSGETHAIRKTLDKLRVLHAYRNGPMSTMGLFEQLAVRPKRTIVIDELPSLFDERMTLQVLLAALGGEPGQSRLITYSTKRKEECGKTLAFAGEVIAIPRGSLATTHSRNT